jgi:hypothetical protein
LRENERALSVSYNIVKSEYSEKSTLFSSVAQLWMPFLPVEPNLSVVDSGI